MSAALRLHPTCANLISISLVISLLNSAYDLLLISCFIILFRPSYSFFFFFNDTATTDIYPLSLPDALPIWSDPQQPGDPPRDARKQERYEHPPRDLTRFDCCSPARVPHERPEKEKEKRAKCRRDTFDPPAKPEAKASDTHRHRNQPVMQLTLRPTERHAQPTRSNVYGSHQGSRGEESERRDGRDPLSSQNDAHNVLRESKREDDQRDIDGGKKSYRLQVKSGITFPVALQATERGHEYAGQRPIHLPDRKQEQTVSPRIKPQCLRAKPVA